MYPIARPKQMYMPEPDTPPSHNVVPDQYHGKSACPASLVIPVQTKTGWIAAEAVVPGERV